MKIQQMWWRLHRHPGINACRNATRDGRCTDSRVLEAKQTKPQSMKQLVALSMIYRTLASTSFRVERKRSSRFWMESSWFNSCCTWKLSQRFVDLVWLSTIFPVSQLSFSLSKIDNSGHRGSRASLRKTLRRRNGISTVAAFSEWFYSMGTTKVILSIIWDILEPSVTHICVYIYIMHYYAWLHSHPNQMEMDPLDRCGRLQYIHGGCPGRCALHGWFLVNLNQSKHPQVGQGRFLLLKL